MGISARFRVRRALRGLALALLSCLIGPATAADGVLVLGRISDNPKAHYEQLKPLLDYVVPRMRSVGIREGRVLMARDAQQMESYLRRGRVDWVTETAAMAVLLERRAGAEVLLGTERDGVRAYRSLFFARRDSGIAALADLRGRSLALQNRASTSAYFVPAAALLDDGQDLELLLSPMDRPSKSSVGYLFAGSGANISTWVHKRLVDAGVMSNLDWDDPRRLPESYRDDFSIFDETATFPRALEMVRGDLDPAVEAKLKAVLLGASEDPDAHEALLRFFRTTGFYAVDTETTAALRRLGEGAIRVRMQLE